METLIKDAEDFVTHYLNDNLDAKFVYHNLAHTQRVVSKVEDLIEESNLSDGEKQQLLVAAWFHDTGFTKTIKGHEAESVKIASDFLKSKSVSEENIEAISKIIMATKMDYESKTEIEGLIRDADSAHISSKNYENYASLLRKEWELTSNKKYSKSEWLEENIQFLSKHSFYSALATSKWESRKGKNLAKLIQSQNKIIRLTRKH